MPNDLPLLPPKNQQKHLDKTMISPPMDFRHLAHVGPKTPSEIENIRNSDNVIKAVNEVSDYMKPSSSTNSTMKSIRSERIRLDDVFPVRSSEEEVIRSYENQPTSHRYVNIPSLPVRPSRKKYKAPAPPTPPPQSMKPNLVYNPETAADPPVVFRSISKGTEFSTPLPSPKIFTPERIEAPKQNSVIIERPGDLRSFGAFGFGLDDCIPITKQTSPLKTLSPLHRPIAIPKEKEETPILSPASPPHDGYMSTIRSTSVQGNKILEELDSWLDELDDDDKEKLSTISTDESGYPTLALEKDRVFMKHLVEKYELGVEPETIRLRKKKNPAPRLPIETLSSPEYQSPVVGSIPPFSARPVSMPPNRPPPSYDAPSFDAPLYEPAAAALLNGRALTKQNALDLRSSEEGAMPPAIARYLADKRLKSSTMPMSIGRMSSSGFTDVSTTSSRSDGVSSEILSTLGEEPTEVLARCQDVEEQVVPVPIPKPRTKKSISTEPLVEEIETPVGKVEKIEEIDGENKNENVIDEEFEVIETIETLALSDEVRLDISEQDRRKQQEQQEQQQKGEPEDVKDDDEDEEEEDEEGDLIVTRF